MIDLIYIYMVIIFEYLQETPGGFAMKDESLPFSVMIFTICAVSTLAMLMVRRSLAFFGNAELGGPMFPKILSSCVFIGLWILYVLLASLQAYKYIPPL